MRKLGVVLTMFALSAPLHAQTKLPAAAAIKVDYTKDIRPLLAQNCYGCHGPEVQQSGLRLDLRQNALRGGDYGPVITPGDSANSKLIRRVVDGDGGLQMPPTGALTDDEIGLLRAWIDQGAEYRNDVVEAPPKPTDPKLASFINAIRAGDQRQIEKMISASPELLRQQDTFGSTALHHAAGFGSLDTVKLLLDKGADVNAKNRRDSTPLHWAIHDEAKVKLLLAKGAAVNAKLVEGRTPLYQSALLANGNAVMKLLLDKGADPNIPAINGQTPLMLCAVRGDVNAMRMLIDKGANVKAKNGAGDTALMSAATNGNPQAVQFLLDKGADATVKSKRNETALGNAATAGMDETIQVLLNHGAEVNVRNVRGYSPLMLAAGADAMPTGVVRMLLDKGADRNFSADYDETAAILAAKRGDTEVARLLGAHAEPIVNASGVSVPAKAAGLATAVAKAVDIMSKQSYNFIRTGGCNSCHSQDLPSAASGFARDRGISVPAIPQLPENMIAPPERIVDLNVVSVTSSAWELFDLGMNHAPRTTFTDSIVRYIKAMQTAQGNWLTNEGRRPPMNAGDYQAAALAIYALKHFGPPVEKTSTDAAIAKAVAWLESAKPENTQDRAFHLLGLAWANGSPAIIKEAARGLVAMQRADGGWSQLTTLASDAYATGEVLFALNTAAKMAVSDPVYQKGIGYLTRTQAADGSWHVVTRSIWFQPYFESGFPYGRDQFISTAGTAWASMALAAAAETPKTSAKKSNNR